MSDVAIPRASLNRLENAVAAIDQKQMATLANIGQIEQQQTELDNRVQHLMAAFQEFVQSDRMAKELQLAETRIVKVRQELESTYGHYGEVRRRAVGVLQALDAALVTHETIQSTTENVMMATPRYWLAPALVALAAWIRDDRDLAQRALGEALRRDLDKTSLFFSLVLRRYERRAGAARWLGQFFARQDPTALHREFVLILDAVATGAFGPEAKSVASQRIEQWLVQLSSQSGFADSQHRRWETTLASLTPTMSGEYELLRKLSPTWPLLEASLCAARRNRLVIAHFVGIFDGPLKIPSQLRDQVDDLLATLVSRFDVEELPLRQQEAELAAIIEARGDAEVASKRFAVIQQALVETVDFPTLLTNAAMHADEAGASRGTQRLAVAMSRDWILTAHDTLTASTRAGVPGQIELALEDWKASVGRDSDHDKLAKDFAQHMDTKIEASVAAIKFTGGPLFSAVASPLVLIVGIASGSVVLIVAAVIAALYGVYGYQGLGRKREAAREAGLAGKQRACEELKGCLSEIVDYREEWAEQDCYAEEAHEMLASISTSQYELSRSDDARAVIS
jgi:TolA-binding protein